MFKDTGVTPRQAHGAAIAAVVVFFIFIIIFMTSK